MKNWFIVAATLVLCRAAGPVLAGPDVYESDDTRSTARNAPSGVTQFRSIDEAGDTDWAKITVGGSGAQYLKVETGGSAYGDTVVWLYSGDGRLVKFDDDSGLGKYSYIRTGFLRPRTYYVKVQEYGNDAPIPFYMLRTTWKTVIVDPDEYESDNVMRAAKLIENGEPQTRSIHRPGNVDFAKMRIKGDGAQNIRIETRGPPGYDTQMWLYKTDGTRLAYDNNSGYRNYSRINIRSLPRGTYMIKVQEKANDGLIPEYTLKATWTVTNRLTGEIDGPITWLHTDVSNWPITTQVNPSIGNGWINFPYDKANVWPGVFTVGATVNANPWVIVKLDDGKWYAATFEWLRPGQTRKPMGVLDGSMGDHIKVAPLNRWRPRSGERFGIMVSGLARSRVRNVEERSNIVMVTWP